MIVDAISMGAVVDKALENTKELLFTPDEEKQTFGYYMEGEGHIFVGNFEGGIVPLNILGDILEVRGLISRIGCMTTRPYQGNRKPLYLGAEQGYVGCYLVVRMSMDEEEARVRAYIAMVMCGNCSVRDTCDHVGNCKEVVDAVIASMKAQSK